ncbi:response regulator [Kaistia geumhonensis]|uniref:CheY-like chemotaxis protein n=1 Tax=Kaistia geumhonensis TaxID=410839 RepID=A0ABU0M1Q9_9HYPH|nr:response regulator [Kaistia geumhonensis]MCX5479890.1 response regulator [Kaistia geumhonensis]MDQ0514883.1 CheY-like chemotaxis protein [Kaistia geumhonensis]
MALILLVEDNELNRDMLSRRLKRAGHDVVLAVDGQEAVTKALGDKPDIVLMDLSLPVFDGWEATRRIRAGMTGERLPIIALTAHAMVGERERALEAGCDDFDTKPVDFERLSGKIAALLARPA